MTALGVLRDEVPEEPLPERRGSLTRVGEPRGGERSSASTAYRASDGRTLIGLSTLVLGSMALGFVFAGFISGNEVVPILLASTFGLTGAGAAYAWVRQYAYSLVFVAFAGLNGTYALLQLGVTNNWYGIPIQDLSNVVSVYIAIWLVVFAIIGCAEVASAAWRLAVIVVVAVVALALVLAANLMGSITLLRWGSLGAFLDASVGAGLLFEVILGWRRRAVLHR